MPRQPHVTNSIAGRWRRHGKPLSPCVPSDEIGDDAFHRIEEELDWLEMAEGAAGREG